MRGRVPKVTMALLMCELSLYLASSLCVSVHSLRHPATILQGSTLSCPDLAAPAELSWLGSSKERQLPLCPSPQHTHARTHAHTHMHRHIDHVLTHAHIRTHTHTHIPQAGLISVRISSPAMFFPSVMDTSCQNIFYFQRRAWPMFERGGKVKRRMRQG